MTHYEIADIRAALGMRYVAVLTLWNASVLALYAAAYAAGPQLNGFGIAALMLFSAIVTFTTLAGQRIAVDQMDALWEDVSARAGKGETFPPILQQKRLVAPANLRVFAPGLAIVVFIGFQFFVLERAGLIF